MFNLKRLDKKLYQSGGWENINNDIELLKDYRISAVVDLQYTPDDDSKVIEEIGNQLKDAGIDYIAIPIWDADYNANPEHLFYTAAESIHRFMLDRENTKDAVLVKCGAGLSRSVAAVIWWKCYHQDMTYLEAVEWYRNQAIEYQYQFEWLPPNSLMAINYSFIALLKEKFPDEW